MGLETDESSTWTGEIWNGLMLSPTDATYMQCCNSSFWHFAIGAYVNYRYPNTFPGPWVIGSSTGDSFDANKVVLWMEIKSFTDVFEFTVCSNNCNVYFNILFNCINAFVVI